ncbi:MAG: D-glycero-beta-D-manno-heptose-7-phosphate kinase [Candidatus Cloacimonetes bacterium]|nr:D-glycero-beta-D-manno-heptose-7-phosphate kinase [Candidatus Cloacimonadota bacterium]MBL7085568.1 D-glycero-beta-D-manno-heptose-7-phosphate kinase [Candidatus Cloacimonadota bacterium]
MNIEESKLKNILNEFSNKKILVIGDLMLDHYIIGDVKRISPEAPVQVVKVDNEHFGPGGAANVANNIKSLGAVPFVIGTVGDDSNAEKLYSIFQKQGISNNGIFINKNQPTTQKTRVIARHQHLIRIDFENLDELSDDLTHKIKEYFKKIVKEVDAIIIQDYNKGMLSKNLIKFILKTSNKNKKIIGVDPKVYNFLEYQNATLFKPNKQEVANNLNIEIKNEEDLLFAAKRLKQRIKCAYLVITLGEEGLFVYENEETYWKIPTFSQEVYDVSGAGDTVICALVLAMVSGCDIKTSSIIANHAAGVVCGKVGAAAASPEEIILSFKKWNKS